MTREELSKQLLETKSNNILLELTTGYGKTKFALDKICTIYKKDFKILILVPRLVLIDSWKKEIIKWKKEFLLENITFSAYNSIEKHIGKWDIVIYDEAHHLSEKRRGILVNYDTQYNILLSATIKKELRHALNKLFPNINTFKITVKQAIDLEVLPDPQVYLIPLVLPNDKEVIVKNHSGKIPITCRYQDRWKYIKNKNNKVTILCNSQEYLEEINSQIEWFKKQYFITNNPIFKSKWLNLCGNRLKWLSNKKNNIILYLLKKYNKERVITFCNSIEQTEVLGKYCINSKNKNSEQYLEMFNTHKINHITTCDMLNEGVNLTDCKIGLYASLNSSEILIKQKLGRLLRHKSPLIIIPYYRGTREEEIVGKMIEDYNPELITIIKNITF